MRPDHDLRRKVIRQWMLLPRSKRTTEEAETFVAKVLAANTLGPGRDDPHRRVMAWLASRTAKT